MTLAMTLGMSIGIRKTLWMMYGELLGVAIVAISSVIGVSAIMLNSPITFTILKMLGALYLLYIGINMWRSKGKLAVSSDKTINIKVNKSFLFQQGFLTAIANPKGWAFMISLLPPFINASYALPTQLVALIGVIVISEFSCMMLYAAGGKSIGRLLVRQDNVKLLNKISGSLMIFVAIWLAAS